MALQILSLCLKSVNSELEFRIKNLHIIKFMKQLRRLLSILFSLGIGVSF